MSRFLAVESCGQCTPCKLDGLRIAELLEATAARRCDERRPRRAAPRIATVADGARCSLATQQQVVVASLLDMCPDDVDAHLERRVHRGRARAVAELVGIDDGVARIDERHAAKQPDWTYDAVDSGKSPAARLGEHREPLELDE